MLPLHCSLSANTLPDIHSATVFHSGNPSYIDEASGDIVECGYAPVIAIVADHADWPPPSWFSGTLIIDETMVSPLQCQTLCFTTAECDYFSYEWEYTAGGMYHECYLKYAYTDDNTPADIDAARCMVDPYVPWASQDPQWHGQSGPGIECASITELELACGGQIGMDFG